MHYFFEDYWKKHLAKTVFPGEKGKWPENGRNGEKGKRNRMPGKGKRQSPRIGAQVFWQGMDEDGSGMVDFEEFMLWYRKNFSSTDGAMKNPVEAFYAQLQSARMPRFEKEGGLPPLSAYLPSNQKR